MEGLVTVPEVQLDLFEEVQLVLDFYFPEGEVPSRTRDAIERGDCHLIYGEELANNDNDKAPVSSPLPS